MSHLVSDNIGGNLHEAASTINRLGMGQFVLHLHYSPNSVVVVYRFDNYPDYVWYCEKIGRTPLKPEEFFGYPFRQFGG